MKNFIAPAPGDALSEAQIAANLSDLHPVLSPAEARREAAVCLYCYDAPCVAACPTAIDIPGFIRRIQGADPLSAGEKILSANILGGTCARACPTEVLCEGACVVNRTEGRPVKIGALQRLAVDAVIAGAGPHPFARGARTGKRLAVIGAGPAGLAFAHRAAMLGHDVVIFDAREKPGGLNEYGLAAYKMTEDFAQREAAFLMAIGGIELRSGQRLGRDVGLAELKRDFDGVFLGLGLEKPAALDTPGADLPGVEDALGFIARLRTGFQSAFAPGARVAVIGGGNTAVDAAVQAVALGASTVSLFYRRGRTEMGATAWEQDLAAHAGVSLNFWLQPARIASDPKGLRLWLAQTRTENGRLVTAAEAERAETFDLILVAIGQALDAAAAAGLTIKAGRIAIDADYRTSDPAVFAGGDCVKSGLDLTVQAVEDGKRAAIAMDRHLRLGPLCQTPVRRESKNG